MHAADCLAQHDDLAVKTALVRVGLVERTPVLGFVLRYGQLGLFQFHLDAVLFRQAVAQFERLGELVAGLEIEHLRPRLDPRQHVNDHAAFRAEGGRHRQVGEEPVDRPADNFLGSRLGQALVGLGQFLAQRGREGQGSGLSRIGRGWGHGREGHGGPAVGGSAPVAAGGNPVRLTTCLES